MANNVDITSGGIRRVLKNYNPQLAIAEYIWNGFDAKAKTIHLNYDSNELGLLDNIEIIDDGYGIDFEKLKLKFIPFYESEKAIEVSNATNKHTSALHGKNGVGRLTFFTFANNAQWITTFKKDEKLVSFSIKIDSTSLKSYDSSLLSESIEENTGTKVTFTNVKISREDLEDTIITFLKSEFCWFLELNKNFKIIINGEPLDYTSNIADCKNDLEIVYPDSKTVFKIKYIQWKYSLRKEFSKYYYLNDEQNEIYKEYTTLNKKGDEFFHSIYVESNFFNDFDFKSSEDEDQIKLFGKAKSSPEFKFLQKEVNKFLISKRKPFLRISASKLVEKYEQDGILPTYKTEWEEKFKKPQLEETIIGLYEAQPKIFNSLNIEQKKIFVRLLDLLLDSNERESVFTILDQIIELEPDERTDLANLFKTTRLNRIIETIKLIEDRYKTYYMLKDLVFNPDLKADEVHHLQKLIESHYWIFGEQYHLVTAAEPKFEEALRRFTYLLTKDDEHSELNIDISINHPHKLKEMDIFACRQNTFSDKIESIVIELKHPKINLGAKQYNQVFDYLDIISKQPDFNASNMHWEFYLVGNKFASSGFIKDQIETNKPHGIRSLIMNKDNGRIKVFAKTWSEIFNEFEIKHKFLDDKLKLERTMLFNELKTANEVIEAVQNNTVIQPKEVSII
jgi:hypothetical protein